MKATETVSIRLPVDTATVLRDVSESYRLPQSAICDKAISTELISIMAAEKPADIMAEYKKWKTKG